MSDSDIIVCAACGAPNVLTAEQLDAIEEEARTVNPEGRSTDEDGLRAAIRAAFDATSVNADGIDWGCAGDLDGLATRLASALTTSSPGDELGAAAWCVECGESWPYSDPARWGERFDRSHRLSADRVAGFLRSVVASGERLTDDDVDEVDAAIRDLIVTTADATWDLSATGSPKEAAPDGAAAAASCPCRDFDAYPDGDGECRRCGHDASSHVQISDDAAISQSEVSQIGDQG